jgi:hypothetical protein
VRRVGGLRGVVSVYAGRGRVGAAVPCRLGPEAHERVLIETDAFVGSKEHKESYASHNRGHASNHPVGDGLAADHLRTWRGVRAARARA